MEKPMSTVIDYEYQQNRVIEDSIREYYPQVKALIEIVITKRLRNPNTPHGLCADFIEEDEKLWQEGVNPGKLTQEEEAILRLTEEVWNRFLELPINHPMEANEIAMKIHDIQRMIISRPGFRMNQEMFRQYGNGNCNKG